MWKIELMFASGWDDAEWTTTHGNRTIPLRFTSKREAEAGIDEFIADTKAAADRGDMSEYRREDLRAVPEEV